MNHSELWESIEAVFGSAYGRSLMRDLYLAKLGMTGEAALEAGVPPRDVWHALSDDMGVSDDKRWIYRAKRKGDDE